MKDNEIKTGLHFLIKTIDMACFRRSGMQWGVGETESGQKKQKKNQKRKKDRGTKKGQRRKDEKERRKRRTGRACFLLLRLPFCAVLSASRDAAILANQ